MKHIYAEYFFFLFKERLWATVSFLY